MIEVKVIVDGIHYGHAEIAALLQRCERLEAEVGRLEAAFSDSLRLIGNTDKRYHKAEAERDALREALGDTYYAIQPRALTILGHVLYDRVKRLLGMPNATAHGEES